MRVSGFLCGHVEYTAWQDPLEASHLLENLNGLWNIQADSVVQNLMDFSDYFTLPFSPLHPAWRMSEDAVHRACMLEAREGTDFHRALFASPHRLQQVFGTSDVAAAKVRHAVCLCGVKIRFTLQAFLLSSHY